MEKKTNYPNPSINEGWHYDSADEETAGVETKEYENGAMVKRVMLSDGRSAVCRKLKGRDFVETKKRIQADNSLDFETINMSVATKINDQQFPPEHYLDDMYQDDYAKIMVAYGKLNF